MSTFHYISFYQPICDNLLKQKMYYNSNYIIRYWTFWGEFLVSYLLRERQIDWSSNTLISYAICPTILPQNVKNIIFHLLQELQPSFMHTPSYKPSCYLSLSLSLYLSYPSMMEVSSLGLFTLLFTLSMGLSHCGAQTHSDVIRLPGFC